jgi:hypothetical protein
MKLYCSYTKKGIAVPTVRKLAPDEVQTLQTKGKGQRKLVEEEYDRYLADYGSGDYGEAELGVDEKRLTVRNRFKAAAGRRGIQLTFMRTKGSVLRFTVAPTLAAAGVESGSTNGATHDGRGAQAVSSGSSSSGKGKGRRKRAEV